MSDESNTPKPPVCRRATPREGTSYMAFRHEPLEPGDPLLGFTPVLHKEPRRNTITPPRQRAFVAALAECGIVVQAARKIGASTDALYRLRNRPDGGEFCAAWDAAIDRGVMRLEDCALARAIEGEERMVVSAGKHMGTEVRYNDNLVMFFLRARRGERYAPDWRALKPGHPLYERIAVEAVARHRAQEEENEGATLEALDAFFEDLRQRRLASERLAAEMAAEDEAAEAEEQTRARARRPAPPEEEAPGDDPGD